MSGDDMGDEFENCVLDEFLEEMGLPHRDLACAKCPKPSGMISTMQKIYRPSSGHGRGTTDKTIYINPHVSWICISCESEYSRWCDQPKNKKKYKPGCRKHKFAPCLWINRNFEKKNKNPHWILYCLICKAAGIKHNQSMPPGAVRGRCPNCLAPNFQAKDAQPSFERQAGVEECRNRRPNIITYSAGQKRKAPASPANSPSLLPVVSFEDAKADARLERARQRRKLTGSVFRELDTTALTPSEIERITIEEATNLIQELKQFVKKRTRKFRQLKRVNLSSHTPLLADVHAAKKQVIEDRKWLHKRFGMAAFPSMNFAHMKASEIKRLNAEQVKKLALELQRLIQKRTQVFLQYQFQQLRRVDLSSHQSLRQISNLDVDLRSKNNSDDDSGNRVDTSAVITSASEVKRDHEIDSDSDSDLEDSIREIVSCVVMYEVCQLGGRPSPVEETKSNSCSARADIASSASDSSTRTEKEIIASHEVSTISTARHDKISKRVATSNPDAESTCDPNFYFVNDLDSTLSQSPGADKKSFPTSNDDNDSSPGHNLAISTNAHLDHDLTAPYSNGVCIEVCMDIGILLATKHGVDGLRGNYVIVVSTYDQRTRRRCRKFIAEVLHAPNDSIAIFEDEEKEIQSAHDLDLTVLRITHMYDATRDDFRGRNIKCDDLKTLSPLPLCTRKARVGNAIRLVGFLKLQLDTVQMPEVKKGSVQSRTRSEVGIGIEELWKGVSGSIGVNEWGEAAVMVTARPPDRIERAVIPKLDAAAHVKQPIRCKYYSLCLFAPKVQRYIDNVLAYHSIDVTVKALQHKYADTRVFWGSQDPSNKTAHGVRVCVAFAVVFCCIGGIIAAIVKFDFYGLERCPVSFENAIDFEKCFCHGKTCSKGQYCYRENNEFSCRSSPIVQCKFDAFARVDRTCFCGTNNETCNDFCYDYACHAESITCVRRQIGGCVGSKPPSCSDGVQNFECINNATGNVDQCEGKCNGDMWVPCSKTVRYEDFTVLEKANYDAAYTIGSNHTQSNCSVIVTYTKSDNAQNHFACLTKNGAQKEIFKSDRKVAYLFIQDTESPISDYLWFVDSPNLMCPRVFRVLCDFTVPRCATNASSIWTQSRCQSTQMVLHRVITVEGSVFALLSSFFKTMGFTQLYIMDWTHGDESPMQQPYQAKQNLCVETDFCEFDFAATASPAHSKTVAFNFSILSQGPDSGLPTLWIHSLHRDGTLVLQRQSNPQFKGNSPPGNCNTYTGFGCWCDMGNEIFYLDVHQKKNSKKYKKSCVRKQNVNTGDDVCVKHSIHTSNQEYDLTQFQCGSFRRDRESSMSWKSTNRQKGNKTMVFTTARCVDKKP